MAFHVEPLTIEIANALCEKIKKKLEDGTYLLQIPGQEPMILLPLPAGARLEIFG